MKSDYSNLNSRCVNYVGGFLPREHKESVIFSELSGKEFEEWLNERAHSEYFESIKID